MTLTIVIDTLPDLELSANRRQQGAWYSHSGAIKRERERAAWLIVATQPREEFRRPVKLTYSFRFPETPLPYSLRVSDRLRRDPDNMAGCVKPWTDALCDLGVLVGDSARWIPGGVRYIIEPEPGGPQTTITIEEQPECKPASGSHSQMLLLQPSTRTLRGRRWVAVPSTFEGHSGTTIL